MESEHHRYATLLGSKHQRRGQVVQVTHMHHIRLYLVEDVGESVIHGLVTVAVPGPGHVDHVKSDRRFRWVGIPLHGVFQEEGVFLPRENVNLMPLRQCLRYALGIHLRAGVIAHRVAVNYLEDSQRQAFHFLSSPLDYTPSILTGDDIHGLISGQRLGLQPSIAPRLRGTSQRPSWIPCNA